MKVNVGLQSNIQYGRGSNTVKKCSWFITFFFLSNNLRKCMWFRLCSWPIM